MMSMCTKDVSLKLTAGIDSLKRHRGTLRNCSPLTRAIAVLFRVQVAL